MFLSILSMKLNVFKLIFAPQSLLLMYFWKFFIILQCILNPFHVINFSKLILFAAQANFDVFFGNFWSFSNFFYSFHCSAMDYSVETNHLSPKELQQQLKELEQQQQLKKIGDWKFHQAKTKLQNTLRRHLEKCHPIHQFLRSISRQDIKSLFITLNFKHEEHHNRNLSKVAKYCFQQHPEAPMTYLSSLLGCEHPSKRQKLSDHHQEPKLITSGLSESAFLSASRRSRCWRF